MRTANEKSWAQRSAFGPSVFTGLDLGVLSANLEQLARANSKLFDLANDELCEFSKSRLARNLEANRRMTGCGTFDEAFETQTDFAWTLIKEYITESAKLAEMSTQVIFDGLSAWKALATREEGETTKHSMAAE